MKKVLVATAALAAWVSAGFGGIGVNWTAGGRVYGMDGERGIAAEDDVTWQLIYAGPNGVADAVDLEASDWVGGDDVVLAVRHVPAGGGAADDGTEWDECLAKLGGDSVYVDTGWWATNDCHVYQRIYQGRPGQDAGFGVYQSGVFALDASYSGGLSFPQMFGAAAGSPDGAVSASWHDGTVIPEEKIDWGEDVWCEWGFCAESWKNDAWSNGDWHFDEAGETHVAGIFSMATWMDDGIPIRLSVEPDDGTIGLSSRTLELVNDGFLRATFEVTLLAEPPNGGATYTIRAKPGNGWFSITHSVTVGEPAVDWQYAVTEGGAVVTGAVPARGNLVIPEELGGYPVTGIGRFAFYDCGGLTGVTIPSGVTSIGEGAFAKCSGLRSMHAC